jgi:hypothetical protein
MIGGRENGRPSRARPFGRWGEARNTERRRPRAAFVAAAAILLSGTLLVARVAQNWGYSFLSLTRASLVVNCQLALA